MFHQVERDLVLALIPDKKDKTVLALEFLTKTADALLLQSLLYHYHL